VNTWHKPARSPQIPSTTTLCTKSAHPYQNKWFIKQKSAFLSPLFSHSCAHLRLQPLCFDMLHKNTKGEGVTPSPTFPSRIGMGGGASDRKEEGVWGVFAFWGACMSDMNVRPPKEAEGSLASLPSQLGAGGMTARRIGKRNPRTGLKTGHYIRKRAAILRRARRAAQTQRGGRTPGRRASATTNRKHSLPRPPSRKPEDSANSVA